MTDLFDKPETPAIFQYETLGNGRAIVTIFCEIKCCQVPYKPYGKPLEAEVSKMDTLVSYLNKDYKRKAKINV